nr:hypothetical protein [PVC group bacterium]
MTLDKKHGETTFKMAWVVEISLFTMAICIAIFNLVTSWNHGEVISIITATMLFIGWIGIACIELCTIPLAGSLALTNLREKPLSLIAVFGLAMLSAWTVYEFNEAASYYMTKSGREALIENERAEREIDGLKLQIEQVELNVSQTDDRLSVARTIHEQELEQFESNYSSSKEKIEKSYNERRDQLVQRLDSLQGNDIFSKNATDRIDEIVLEIENKKQEHELLISKQIDSYKEIIKTNNEAIDRLDEKISTTKTGPFTGGSEQIAKLQKEKKVYSESNRKIQRQNEELYQSRITGPDLASQNTELDEIRNKRTYQQETQAVENKSKITSIDLELRELENNYAVDLKQLNDNYQTDLEQANTEYHSNKIALADSWDNSDEKVPALQANVLAIEEAITKRTQEIDLELGSVLYFRMAKWFYRGEGLPDTEAYGKVQWYIFAPLGLFYSLASIALAYTGMTLRRTDRKSPVEEKQFKKENQLALHVSTLEQQFKDQCVALVAARQEAFEAIKAVPQTVTLSAGNTQTKVSRNYLPWIACVLITMMGFGTIVTTVAMNRGLRQQDLLVKQPFDNQEQLEVQRTINSVMDAVVVVETEEGSGSGFFIDADGLVATNYHVVEELNEVNVMTRSGLSLLGQVIRRDKLA